MNLLVLVERYVFFVVFLKVDVCVHACVFINISKHSLLFLQISIIQENDGEKSNMASLIIIGEYDEMKQLVRDGAKKLRDAEGLPDEALLAINRPRHSSPKKNIIHSSHSSSSSSRKRFSSPSQHVPSSAESPGGSRLRSRNKMQQELHNNSNMMHSNNTPPKIKGHPRDRPSSRRNGEEGRRFSATGDKCNDLDWGDALGLSRGFDTIWNCGATGGTSPSNKNSKNPSSTSRRSSSSSKIHYTEGRNESSARFGRGGGVTAERDAPLSKDVMIL